MASIQRTCRICGCTETEPCIVHTEGGGVSCSWVSCRWTSDLVCDVCAEAITQLVPFLLVHIYDPDHGEGALQNLMRDARAIALKAVAPEGQPVIEVCSEAEAAQYLRARGAGAA